MNRLRATTFLVLTSTFVMAAGSSDDVKDYLTKAQQNARGWQPDAQLVYVTVGSSVQPDGSNLCSPDRPSTGWNYAYYSKSADAYYTVYGCKGKMTGEPTGKGFQTPPAAINGDFIGTNQVVDILRGISHGWHLSHCQSVQALRTGEESVPVWSTMLDCGDVGGTVMIDATSGKVLKSKKTS
jgi:hypothetical protein